MKATKGVQHCAICSRPALSLYLCSSLPLQSFAVNLFWNEIYIFVFFSKIYRECLMILII